MNTPSHDTRRAPRRQMATPVAVIDQMREALVGHLVNLSETGMLMLASAPLQDDALYQLRFALALDDGRRVDIDAGVHLLWSEPAQLPGQAWAGFRFLTLSGEHRQWVRAWVGEEDSPAPLSTD